MSDLHVHTETPTTKTDRVDQLGRVVGVIFVTTVGVLAVSLIVWGIVAVWRNILGG